MALPANLLITQGIVQKVDARTSRSRSFTTVADVLSEAAKDGVGLEASQYGYVVLPSYNSTTGVTTKMALYVVDGALKVATVAAAEAELAGYQAL